MHEAIPHPTRSRFATRHPHAYLVLHLFGGLCATALMLWIFLAIAEDLPEQGTLIRTDMAVARWLEAHGTEPGERIFFSLSYLGAPVLVACVVAAIVYFAWRRQRREALAVSVTSGGGVIVSNILKLVFHRGRPETASEFITRHTWSFPSGHSMNSIIGYGFLTLLLLDHVAQRRRRLALIVGAVLLIGAIGFSRLYLGVHYLSDVGGGFIAGGAWLTVCATGYRFAQRRVPQR
jgi:undecaprenyl-diphosphatase